MKSLAAIALVFIVFSSEAQTKKHTVDPKVAAEQKERLIMMNKRLLSNESAEIDAYIKAHDLTMQRTGSGLRYVVKKGKGAPIKHKESEKVSIAYTLGDLKGKVFYTINASEPFVFNPGRSELIRGIQEAVIYMNPGDEATLIIPAHMGYGKNGDKKKVPPSCILLCKLQLLKIE
jgi:FKBP-type peptidyl-prolyl cis-trans isomerase